tara:strand:+ start:497 stop:1189 length:693 start_codon:yes stop_codon:yes gene_type:complete
MMTQTTETISPKLAKLQRTKRWQAQVKASDKTLTLEQDIDGLVSDLRTKLAIAFFDQVCTWVAVRVLDIQTDGELLEAQNNHIQIVRGCSPTQRKRISQMLSSQKLADMVQAGQGCKDWQDVKEMLAGHKIDSMAKLRKAVVAKPSADDKAKAIQAGRAQLGIDDPSGQDGLQGLFDKCTQLAKACESLPTQDLPIFEAGLLTIIKRVVKAGDKRAKATEKAEAKAAKAA